MSEELQKKSRLKSFVWKYFNRQKNSDYSSCNLCRKQLKCVGGSTRGLISHLKFLHKITADSFLGDNEHQKHHLIALSEHSNRSEGFKPDSLTSINNKGNNDDLKDEDPMVSDENYQEYDDTGEDEEGRNHKKKITYRSVSSIYRSPIWKYFHQSSDKLTAKCLICHKRLKTTASSTRGLHSHLRAIHHIDANLEMFKETSEDLDEKTVIESLEDSEVQHQQKQHPNNNGLDSVIKSIIDPSLQESHQNQINQYYNNTTSQQQQQQPTGQGQQFHHIEVKSNNLGDSENHVGLNDPTIMQMVYDNLNVNTNPTSATTTIQMNDCHSYIVTNPIITIQNTTATESYETSATTTTTTATISNQLPLQNDLCWVDTSKMSIQLQQDLFPKTNLAVVLYGRNDLQLQQWPLPEKLEPDEVLLKSHSIAICGTDLQLWHNAQVANFNLNKPFCLGREPSAIVMKCGKDVHHLKPGDRVAVNTAIPCERCTLCRSGQQNLCPISNQRCQGLPNTNGCLRRYYTHRADFCLKLPDSVTLEEGALVESLASIVYVCRRVKIQPEDSVLVFGADSLGIMTVMVAKAFGSLRICVTDTKKSRLDFAKRIGANHIYLIENSKAPSQRSREIIQLMQGRAPDVTVECTGKDLSLVTAIQVTRSCGRLAILGLGSDHNRIPYSAATNKGLAIFFIGLYRTNEDYPFAIRLIETGKIKLKTLISNRFCIEKAIDAFKVAGNENSMKILIQYKD